MSDHSIDPKDAVESIERERPHLVLVCNPNNPTGGSVSADVIERMCAASDQTIVVVDEAYAEFRDPGIASALELLPAHPNLVVSRTLSKGLGLAGLRVGYFAAHPAIVDAIRLVRLPYHLSTLTQAVAIAALRRSAEALAGLAMVREEREALSAWLKGRGFDVVRSDANFLLFGPCSDGALPWQALVERGVLVRDVGPPGWLRVTIGTPHDMTVFRNAIDEVMGRPGVPRRIDGDGH